MDTQPIHLVHTRICLIQLVILTNDSMITEDATDVLVLF